MAQNETLLTYEGLKKLEEEVEYLKTVKRREIAERIKVALGFGDLSENSEYDEAKNEQAQVEMRIAELENKLRNVKIIDEDEIETKTVQVGNVVQVLDIEYDEKLQSDLKKAVLNYYVAEKGKDVKEIYVEPVYITALKKMMEMMGK